MDYQEYFQNNFHLGNSLQVLYENYKMAVQLYTLYFATISKTADDTSEGVLLEDDEALKVCTEEIGMSLYFLRKYKGFILNVPETDPRTKPVEMFNYNFGIFRLANGIPIGSDKEAIRKMADCLTSNIDIENVDVAKLNDYEQGIYLYQAIQ